MTKSNRRVIDVQNASLKRAADCNIGRIWPIFRGFRAIRELTLATVDVASRPDSLETITLFVTSCDATYDLAEAFDVTEALIEYRIKVTGATNLYRRRCA